MQVCQSLESSECYPHYEFGQLKWFKLRKEKWCLSKDDTKKEKNFHNSRASNNITYYLFIL